MCGTEQKTDKQKVIEDLGYHATLGSSKLELSTQAELALLNSGGGVSRPGGGGCHKARLQLSRQRTDFPPDPCAA